MFHVYDKDPERVSWSDANRGRRQETESSSDVNRGSHQETESSSGVNFDKAKAILDGVMRTTDILDASIFPTNGRNSSGMGIAGLSKPTATEACRNSSETVSVGDATSNWRVMVILHGGLPCS